MNQIFIRYMQLPYAVNAFTSLDAEGDYNVYINTRLPEELRYSAFLHEMRHIHRDDFRNDLPLLEAES